MTSRRSRLKAIANLPVRRKPAESEVKNDISCNSAVFEKVAFNGVSEQIMSSSGDKVISENSNASEVVSLGNTASQKNTEGYSQNLNLNFNWKSEESVNNISYCENQECEKNISQINEFSNNDTVKYIDDNDYISNYNNDYDGDINIMKNLCDDSFNNKKFKSSLVSSVIKEKEQIESCREICVRQNSKEFESCNVHDNQIIDHTITSDPDENMKCYTVLTPINISNSNFTFATLTPCEPYDDSISKESDLNPTLDSYEEVQIYTELVRSADLQVDTPKVINSNDECDSLEMVSQQTDSFFTTSVNVESEEKRLFIKPTFKNVNSSKKLNTSENVLTKNSSPQVKNKERNFEFRYSMVKNSEQTNFDNLDPAGIIFKKSKTSGRKWSKCNDFTKKLSDAKREFQKKYEKRKPDRSTLKMIDLIFYNPSTNPMESKSKLEKSGTISEAGNLMEEIRQEEVDDPEAIDSSPETSISNYEESENNKKMPVPQVKIGLNGEIILDEKSLIIETTSAKKGREDLQNSIPVFEDKGYRVPYYGGKARKSREWTDFETKRFYKALNTIGPDFSLMQKYFPRRTRLELKNKFKREERLNRNLIDRALNNPSEFDMTQLENDLAVEKRAEEAVEMRLCMVRDKKAPRKKKVKVRIRSQLSREMIDSEEDSGDSLRDSNSLSCKELSQTERNKKQKEINLIFQKIVLQNSESQAE